ncbi:VacJ family lipoprotein [Methylomicrobium sp. Wu6]|uniref:MlaA family lipoprotein n=1 Tax=Methylomicrobium sp. Wu6 TaxID=3107928 RepID=UPI002DD625A2|nr:VacJ family lipoprotein [Methylomicrobium sp. Wu6]MEC4748287.1 VacJ family lipoprotein [Methylomicrobium sp. Wu6]
MVINKACGGACPGKPFHTFTAPFVLGAVLALSGCASTGEKATTASAPSNTVDPYENINRKVFAFNDKVDNYVAEPIADAYKWVTPQFMQTGVSNFFTNLKNINVVLNDLLQAKFQQSAQDTGRFLINTTAGVGGLFDVAKHAGLEQNDEDFEQTLAVWGVPQGSYLVIPFLGPSTARGIPGSVFDTAANPATYVGLPVQLVSMLNSRANAEGALKFIDEAALDPYVFTRESFLQWRQNLATDGKSEATNDLADFEDDLLDDATKSTDAAKPQSGIKPAAAKELSEAGASKTAPEVHGAVNAEPPVQRATAEPVKTASVSPAPDVAAPIVQGSGSVENEAFRDAKRKYELARFEYQQLKVEEARRKSRKAK